MQTAIYLIIFCLGKQLNLQLFKCAGFDSALAVNWSTSAAFKAIIKLDLALFSVEYKRGRLIHLKEKKTVS